MIFGGFVLAKSIQTQRQNLPDQIQLTWMKMVSILTFITLQSLTQLVEKKTLSEARASLANTYAPRDYGRF